VLATLLQFLGGPIVQKILDFIPDPAERQKQQFALMQAAQEAAAKAEADQRDIDKAEAASPSVFVAGWRPAVGWLCVLTLAYQWMAAPLLTWCANLAALHLGVTIPQLPTLASSDTQTLLYALLGIGGLRTVDKITGNDTLAVGIGKVGQAIKGAVGSK
jgi:hypothetical protein